MRFEKAYNGPQNNLKTKLPADEFYKCIVKYCSKLMSYMNSRYHEVKRLVRHYVDMSSNSNLYFHITVFASSIGDVSHFSRNSLNVRYQCLV